MYVCVCVCRHAYTYDPLINTLPKQPFYNYVLQPVECTLANEALSLQEGMFPSLFLSQMTAVEEDSAELSFSAGSHWSLGWGVSSSDATWVLVLLTVLPAQCLRLVPWGLFSQQGQWAVITSIPYLTSALSYCPQVTAETSPFSTPCKDWKVGIPWIYSGVGRVGSQSEARGAVNEVGSGSQGAKSSRHKE